MLEANALPTELQPLPEIAKVRPVVVALSAPIPEDPVRIQSSATFIRHSLPICCQDKNKEKEAGSFQFLLKYCNLRVKDSLPSYLSQGNVFLPQFG